MQSRSRYRRSLGKPSSWLGLFRRFYAENMMQTSAAMAFVTLLALVPLVTVVLSVGGLVPYLEPLVNQLDALVREALLPPGAASAIAGNIGKFSHKAQQLTVAGIALLTLTAFFLMNHIERAFNHLWQVKPRPIWVRVKLYVFVMIVWPFVLASLALGLSYAVSAALGLLNEPAWFERAVFKIMSLVLLGLFFAFLYYAVPNVRVPIGAALAGGVFAATGFGVLQKIFEVYLVKSALLKGIYGAFATFPLFLVWLHLCWGVVLFGGLIAARGSCRVS